jgi:undecaprenyl-diphosphatase
MLKFIQALDTRTFLSLFNPLQRPDLTRYSIAVSRSADGWLYLTLFPILALVHPTTLTSHTCSVAYAFALERVLYWVLKNGIRRRRPPQVLSDVNAVVHAADRFSLPSGHTSAAFLFITTLCLVITPLLAPLYLWAASVGTSRVILGVHFPSDVILGAVLGSSVAMAVLS